jgi:hypothetical protein
MNSEGGFVPLGSASEGASTAPSDTSPHDSIAAAKPPLEAVICSSSARSLR